MTGWRLVALLAAGAACQERAREVRSEAELKQAVDQMMPAVVRATGLKFRRHPHVLRRTRTQVRDYVIHKFGSDLPPAELACAQAAYRLHRKRGVTHAEFLTAHADGRFYFLEIAARVGGAYIADVIEAATSNNLWREWARLEVGAGKQPYQLPAARRDYAGVILSLARQEVPDTSAYSDPEITHRVTKYHHVGFILKSQSPEGIQQLLDSYATRFHILAGILAMPGILFAVLLATVFSLQGFHGAEQFIIFAPPVNWLGYFLLFFAISRRRAHRQVALHG